MSNISFVFPQEGIFSKFISNRDGETRLGETCLLRETDNDNWKKAKFHIVGVTEDVGPQLNGGNLGATNAFESFLPRFFQVQDNTFLTGKQIAIHGKLVCDETAPLTNNLVEELDEAVSKWIKEVHDANGIPIVIGGGHNNAFGCIKGTFDAFGHAIHVVNLDPHADFRALEGRHSGNPFSYAHAAGMIEKYIPFGLHQSYNNQHILDQLSKIDSEVYWFENWLDNLGAFQKDLEELTEILGKKRVGLELDMDAIKDMPSSARSSSGVTVEQARQYVRKITRSNNVSYFHLPEAAPQTKIEEHYVGKTLAYLVTDFIKCRILKDNG